MQVNNNMSNRFSSMNSTRGNKSSNIMPSKAKQENLTFQGNGKALSIFTAVLILFSSCTKSFRKMSPDELAKVPPKTAQVIDSLANASKKELEPCLPAMKLFKRDTVEVPKDIAKNPNKFENRLLNKADDEIPQVKVGEREVITISTDGDGNLDIDTDIEDVLAKTMEEGGVKIRIGNAFQTTKKGKGVFVPVEYYGWPVDLSNVKAD